MVTHLSLSPQMITGLAALVAGILTYVAENATQIVSPTYAPLVAFIAAAVAAFISHNYYTGTGPTPTPPASGPPAP